MLRLDVVVVAQRTLYPLPVVEAVGEEGGPEKTSCLPDEATK